MVNGINNIQITIKYRLAYLLSSQTHVTHADGAILGRVRHMA